MLEIEHQMTLLFLIRKGLGKEGRTSDKDIYTFL